MPECRRHAVFQLNIIYSARKGQDDFVKMYSSGEFCAADAPFLWKMPVYFFVKKLGSGGDRIQWMKQGAAAGAALRFLQAPSAARRKKRLSARGLRSGSLVTSSLRPGESNVMRSLIFRPLRSGSHPASGLRPGTMQSNANPGYRFALFASFASFALFALAGAAGPAAKFSALYKVPGLRPGTMPARRGGPVVPIGAAGKSR